MSNTAQLPNMQSVNDASIARLYHGLKNLDNNISELKKVTVFQKADQAEKVLHETRVLLSHMVLTIHLLKNDIERLKGNEVQPCTLP